MVHLGSQKMEGPLITNLDRADWAEQALQNFAELTMGGELSEETVADLICDIGHFIELKLGLEKDDVLRLMRFGVGAWNAERNSLDGNPEDNDDVHISLP